MNTVTKKGNTIGISRFFPSSHEFTWACNTFNKETKMANGKELTILGIVLLAALTQQKQTTQNPISTSNTAAPNGNGTTKIATTDTTRVTDTTNTTTIPNCPAQHSESEGCGGTFAGGLMLGLCIPVVLYIVFYCWRRRQSRIKFQNSLSVRADE